MGISRIQKLLYRWNHIRPALLIGYVGAIEGLASFPGKFGSVHSAAVVTVTAAPVAPAQRSAIETALGAPLYDHYRSAAIPWIAGECASHTGLDTFANVQYSEVVGDGGRTVEAGALAQVVAIDLTNRVFPLVRFRLGDKTALIDGDCPCGVTFPRIESVRGRCRVSETLRLPDGQLAARESLTQTFALAPEAIRQFQIHQLADSSWVARCTIETAPNAPTTIDSAIKRIRGFVRGKVPVNLEIVEEIRQDAGGPVRSKVMHRSRADDELCIVGFSISKLILST